MRENESYYLSLSLSPWTERISIFRRQSCVELSIGRQRKQQEGLLISMDYSGVMATVRGGERENRKEREISKSLRRGDF